MHTYARHMHDICTDMHEYIHFPLGYAAKWTCMYLYVFDCICMYVFLCAYLYVSVFMRMYLNVSSRRAYQFSQVHMCKIDVCVCIMYVSCMYVFFCMYLVCIMYVQVCVCTACISPNKYSCTHNFTKWPASGPASRRPHSEQWWAGAHLLCSSIQDNMSDPICCTAARSTRRGGPTRVQGVTNRPPMCINTLVIPSYDLSKLICPVGIGPRGHGRQLPAWKITSQP